MDTEMEPQKDDITKGNSGHGKSTVRLGEVALRPEPGSEQNSSVSQSKEAPAPAGGTQRKSLCGGNDPLMPIVHSV